MEKKELDRKIANSVKWASITEISAKMITPFTNMILARLLSPEEFGVIATVTMVTSFADIFSDAGFQKYLIQHDFKDDEELNKNANVAFWTNLFISAVLWLIISVFSNPIAALVGNPGLGHVIIIASSSLCLTSFSSIQSAIYRKKFDFRTLFIVRIVGAFVPVLVTVPLAALGFSYWALVIGTIATNLVSAVLLTVKSTWKPFAFYSIELLKGMISFSMWILAESLLLWGTSYAGTFVVSRSMTSYYLGIYKNSLSMVNSLMNIVVSSTGAVLLSALSVIKSDEKEYYKVFFDFQKKVSLILVPIGVGAFLYKGLLTTILFGPQWKDAELFVGLYSLAHALTILTGQYVSIIFTSKGRPKLAVVSQVLQMAEMVPILFFTAQKNFTVFTIGCCIARMLYGAINIVLAKIYFSLSPFSMLKNMLPAFVGSAVMTAIAFVAKGLFTGIVWELISILLCCIGYGIVLLLIPETRNFLFSLLGLALKKLNYRK